MNELDKDEKEYVEKQMNDPNPSRGLAFDQKQRLPYKIQKGLRKPGRISYDVLRKAGKGVHVARICINVLKEMVTKTPWVIKMIDPQAKKDDARIKEVTDLFKHPNLNDETMRTLLDKMLEDLLVLDAVTIEKTRYPDGRLAELHYVDAATIRPVYNEHGQQNVMIPITDKKDVVHDLPVSYVQILNNSQYGGPESGDLVAAWPKKDFLYFNMHPQGAMEDFGYGMSPLESVIMVVSNILNADNYNSSYFEEGSFPPIIIQLLQQIDQRDLNAYREYLYSELQGNFHRPAVMAGQNKMEVIDLKNKSAKDMEFMEYMMFMSKLLCAAYGLAPQDIGLTDAVGSKNVAETQKDLSLAKGYSSVLHLIKEVFNQEIVWKDFGYEDMEFDWVSEDSTNPKDAVDMYDKGLRNGSITLNEARQKQGFQPYESWADKPMVLGATGYGPVIAPVVTEQPDSSETGSDEQKKTNDNPKEVGGETPYKKQDKQPAHDDQMSTEKSIQKSIYTMDGYKTWVDDGGYGQPFICMNILTGLGYVVKPPVAVNLDSQDLECEITSELAAMGYNVKPVTKRTFNDIMTNLLETQMVRVEFDKYINMTPEYDSEKWRRKFGGSRKFPYYVTSEFIDGRSLKDPLLLDDIRRDPESYSQAIKDLADLWKIERDLVLGDRRADQYIITPEKRAFGFDYQFKGDEGRWKTTHEAIQIVLNQCPEARQLFEDLIKEKDEPAEKSEKGFKKLLKGLAFFNGYRNEENGQVNVRFGDLFEETKKKEILKLFKDGDLQKIEARGYENSAYMFDFSSAMTSCEDYTRYHPYGSSGVIVEKDIRGVKYIIYKKPYV